MQTLPAAGTAPDSEKEQMPQSSQRARTSALQKNQSRAKQAIDCCKIKRSLPTNPPKEFSYFLGGTIRILAVREMAYAGKWSQVEVAEGLAKPVGPGVWAERILLRPANTSRDFY